jgi:hypothetical protein
MEERQLEWQWQRVQRPKPPAPKPAPRPPHRPDTAEQLEQGLGDLERFMREVGGGRIGPLSRTGASLTVGLRAADDELYYLRIVTRAYPTEPPSCTFVDSAGRPTSSAWPAFNPCGPFRPPKFICTPPTAEFFRYHRERQYDAKEGTLVNTVCTIFTALNSTDYRGRYTGRHEPGGRRRPHRR